jgi:hypothetical protein
MVSSTDCWSGTDGKRAAKCPLVEATITPGAVSELVGTAAVFVGAAGEFVGSAGAPAATAGEPAATAGDASGVLDMAAEADDLLAVDGR